MDTIYWAAVDWRPLRAVGGGPIERYAGDGTWKPAESTDLDEWAKITEETAKCLIIRYDAIAEFNRGKGWG